MIEVRYKARLGNNLFQYCLGRILAEQLNFQLDAAAIPGFPATAEPVRGGAYAEPQQILTGNLIALADILASPAPRRIILDGWFQRAEYFVPYRESIRRWLTLDPAVHVSDEAADLVIHVRRTDYITVGWALPFAFYEAAIQRLLPQGGRIWIVTDDPRDPFFANFRQFDVRFHCGNALEQMAFMMRAPRLIISQSTYSWWPAFLAREQEVACPLPNYGCWATAQEPEGVNLTADSGFIRIPCDEPYVATPSEQRHQMRRARWRNMILRLNRWLGLSLNVPAP